MKKTIFFLLTAILLTASYAQAPVQEKKASVTLPEQDWATIVAIIDNAAISGEIRKPLIQKIMEQATPQLYPAAKTDSTSKKPKQ